MTASVPFYLVDVFADAPLTGNTLALVAHAERLKESVMRAVAREFNQSETTFLLPPTRDGATWRLRSFTPSGAEVVGAGHNALGAWWWLATAGHLALTAVHAPRAAAAPEADTAVEPQAAAASAGPSGDLNAMERAMIEQALQTARFNKSKAAQALGLTRAQLYVRMRKYGLE